MAPSAAELPEPIIRAARLLRAGYYESAIEEAEAREQEAHAVAARIIVIAAFELIITRRKQARRSDEELRRLIVDRIPTLLSTRHPSALVAAMIGARVAPLATRRTVRRGLRSVEGMRPASVSLVLWRVSAMLRRGRWPLFVSFVALWGLGISLANDFQSGSIAGYIAIGAILGYGFALVAWLLSVLTPAPMQYVAERLLSRFADEPEERVELPAMDPPLEWGGPHGCARPDLDPEARSGDTVNIISVDGIVLLRRTVAVGLLMMLVASPLLFVVPLATVVESTGGSVRPYAAAGVLACEFLVVLMVWLNRDRISRRTARMLVPSAVPMGGRLKLDTALGPALVLGAGERRAISVAEGRSLSQRLRLWFRGPAVPQATALYLRSFADDSPVQRGDMATLHAVMYAAMDWIELHIVPNSIEFGLPDAVVKHPMPEGAEWVEEVARLSRKTDLVFLALAPTRGLVTELNLMRSLDLTKRAALFVPFGRHLDWATLGDYLDVLGIELDLASPPSGRPLAVVPGSRPVVFVTRSRAPVFARAVAALEFAVRVLLERKSGPSPAPDVSDA